MKRKEKEKIRPIVPRFHLIIELTRNEMDIALDDRMNRLVTYKLFVPEEPESAADLTCLPDSHTLSSQNFLCTSSF